MQEKWTRTVYHKRFIAEMMETDENAFLNLVECRSGEASKTAEQALQSELSLQEGLC